MAASTKSKPGLNPAKADSAFTAFLTSRAPQEDVAAYEPEALDAAAKLAAAALARHRSGQSVISVDNSDAVDYRGRPLTVITVINDNMPFLFDSIVSEITDSAGEPTLVLHPVLLVKHGRSGVSEIVVSSDPATKRQTTPSGALLLAVIRTGCRPPT